MKRLWWLVGAVMVVLLSLFGLMRLAGVSVLVDAEACRQFLLGRGRWVAGLVGVGLLVVDVFLPVVSSAVMVALGRLFGVAGGGTLAVAGSLGAAWLGYAVGRAGGSRVERWVSATERERVSGWLRRWGWLLVLVSRPLPVLAETVVILAGLMRMDWARLSVAALIGNLPAGFLYAWAGAQAADGLTGVWVFVGVVGVAGLGWWAGRRFLGR